MTEKTTHNKLCNGTASPHNKCGWPLAILSAFAAWRDLRLNKGVSKGFMLLEITYTICRINFNE